MLPSRLAMVSHKAKIHSKADIRDSSGEIEASNDFQILFHKMNYFLTIEKKSFKPIFVNWKLINFIFKVAWLASTVPVHTRTCWTWTSTALKIITKFSRGTGFLVHPATSTSGTNKALSLTRIKSTQRMSPRAKCSALSVLKSSLVWTHFISTRIGNKAT